MFGQIETFAYGYKLDQTAGTAGDPMQDITAVYSLQFASSPFDPERRDFRYNSKTKSHTPFSPALLLIWIAARRPQ